MKASDEDLDWLYPGECRGAVMARWLGSGPGLGVVTAGGAGAVAAAAAASVLDVAPVAVDVVDTVGAGDAFMAALLDGLASAGPLGTHGATRLASTSPATAE